MNAPAPGLLLVTILLITSATDALAEQSEPATLQSRFQELVQPVLQRYCYDCHGEKKQKSGVRMDVLDGSLEDKQLFQWKHVLDQLKNEAMPPEDEDQLTEAEREAVLQWISQALLEGERKVRAKNGSVRRLTVAQFHHTLRDLLGVEDRLADLLPADGISEEGFTNNQDTLVLTPQMLETYFEIADRALDLCLVDETQRPQVQSFRVELGSGVNAAPTTDHLQLNGPKLLSKPDYTVREVVPEKAFAFEPAAMQQTMRFIEGYKGNATVREWKTFEGLYHSVFAAMTGRHTGGYNYGRFSHLVREGLLLRPRSPNTNPVSGPAPTFAVLMRELPMSGMLQVTVQAARYDDGFQPHTAAPESDVRIEVDIASGKVATLTMPAPGVYQLDVVLDGPPKDDVMIADIGSRTFSKRVKGKFTPDADGEVIVPLLVARFTNEAHSLKIRNGKGDNLQRVVITPVAEESEHGRQFAAFDKRVPYVSVHMGVRTDVGPRLSRFADPLPVPSATLERIAFRAPLSSFASPDTETDNVNYLAGLREIGIRSEPTDNRQIPRVLVRAVEVEGPFYETWPPNGHRDIFFLSPHKDDPPTYANKVIKGFATRAFRRPPDEKELESLLAVWRERYEQTEDFQGSVREALLVVLTSPQFLYLTEKSAGPQAEPLSPHELAAKLSYFLWNTTPDEQLLSLASDGELQDALPSQVDRLMADDRFSQFANAFVSGWLNLDKFDVVNINRRKFPRLGKETQRALRQEPIHFITHLLRENLPLRHLIGSDFIVANDVVAGYYGLGNEAEHGLSFAPMAHRNESLGGILTQAAILSGLSNGSESNPIKRGAWFARKIIAEPPEPPPPNVPDLPEGDEAKGKTLRERLEMHRDVKGCRQCHQKIDPWGIPFEAFDAGGLLKRSKVDTRSTLPDNTPIADVTDLKRYLTSERLDQVAFSFLQHLASYAVGRSLTFNEMEYLRREGPNTLAAADYRMRDCVLFVIESPLFLEK
ncbi:MAG: DUF1592 domain-containing protein [Verrucomicrobiaceae bacterium]|nr:DUF1592 domain-containing protein [Verrucomicrobiaceae bacterium]